MASEFFGRQRECRFYTAGCGNKMAVSVTGPRAVYELVGPVIPGIQKNADLSKLRSHPKQLYQIQSAPCVKLSHPYVFLAPLYLTL